MLTVGSLFSGIGGLDLGLERAGMAVRWQCEADPYCRAVLAKHWPDVPCYPDVRELGATVQPVDVLAGGFPCQPVSLAGRRRGAADERWLWPEFARLIRVLRPRYALMENVPGLLAGGGMAEVLGDLAGCGYDAEWDCIPAAAVGAPHLRYRVFIVAYTSERANLGGIPQPGQRTLPTGDGRGDAEVADADSGGRNGRPRQLRSKRRRQLEDGGRPLAEPGGVGRRQGPGVFRRLGSARRSWWESEPDLGRVAHGIPSRVDRLRALGNAVVPQVAEWVGRRILAAEEAA